MFNRLKLIAILFTFCAFGTPAQAQTSVQERAARLHAQLLDLQSKQAELESRLEVLNEQLKPENIEKGKADALAYQQSPLPNPENSATNASSTRPRQASRKRARARRVNR